VCGWVYGMGGWVLTCCLCVGMRDDGRYMRIGWVHPPQCFHTLAPTPTPLLHTHPCLQTARSFHGTLQDELSVLRREVAEQRRAGQEVGRLRQENEALNEKVKRQEAYLVRRFVKERAAATGGSTASPGLVAGAATAASEIFATLDARAAAGQCPASPCPCPSSSMAATTALAIARSTSPLTTASRGKGIGCSSSPRASAALTAVAALMGSPSRRPSSSFSQHYQQGPYATPSKSKPFLSPSPSSSSSSSRPRRREDKENRCIPLGGLPPSSPAADAVAMAAAALQRLGMHSRTEQHPGSQALGLAFAGAASPARAPPPPAAVAAAASAVVVRSRYVQRFDWMDGWMDRL
jgi:hypothetical protein